MASYLSPEWFEQVGALTGPPALAQTGLIVQHLVSGAPGGAVSYYLRLSEAGATIVAGRATRADVTFAEEYDTAIAVARGELTAPAALLAGRIRVGGDLAALVAHQDVLAFDDPVPATVRAETTF